MLWVGKRDSQVGDKTVKLLLNVCCLKFYLVFNKRAETRWMLSTHKYNLGKGFHLRTQIKFSRDDFF